MTETGCSSYRYNSITAFLLFCMISVEVGGAAIKLPISCDQETASNKCPKGLYPRCTEINGIHGTRLVWECFNYWVPEGHFLEIVAGKATMKECKSDQFFADPEPTNKSTKCHTKYPCIQEGMYTFSDGGKIQDRQCGCLYRDGWIAKGTKVPFSRNDPASDLGCKRPETLPPAGQQLSDEYGNVQHCPAGTYKKELGYSQCKKKTECKFGVEKEGNTTDDRTCKEYLPDKDTSTSSSIITTNSSRRTSEQEFKYATTTEASTSPGDDTSTEKLDGKLTVGDITGIVTGSILFAGFIVALLTYLRGEKRCCWRRANGANNPVVGDDNHRDGDNNPADGDNNRRDGDENCWCVLCRIWNCCNHSCNSFNTAKRDERNEDTEMQMAKLNVEANERHVPSANGDIPLTARREEGQTAGREGSNYEPYASSGAFQTTINNLYFENCDETTVNFTRSISNAKLRVTPLHSLQDQDEDDNDEDHSASSSLLTSEVEADSVNDTERKEMLQDSTQNQDEDDNDEDHSASSSLLTSEVEADSVNDTERKEMLQDSTQNQDEDDNDEDHSASSRLLTSEVEADSVNDTERKEMLQDSTQDEDEDDNDEDHSASSSLLTSEVEADSVNDTERKEMLQDSTQDEDEDDNDEDHSVSSSLLMSEVEADSVNDTERKEMLQDSSQDEDEDR